MKRFTLTSIACWAVILALNSFVKADSLVSFTSSSSYNSSISDLAPIPADPLPGGLGGSVTIINYVNQPAPPPRVNYGYGGGYGGLGLTYGGFRTRSLVTLDPFFFDRRFNFRRNAFFFDPVLGFHAGLRGFHGGVGVNGNLLPKREVLRVNNRRGTIVHKARF